MQHFVTETLVVLTPLNKQIISVLQIIDIGLGSKDGNAATVFSQLHGATNNSQIINGFPNMNTSVHVLLTLKEKLTDIQNVLTVDVSKL